MCERCEYYMAVAEEGRRLANERDRLIVEALNKGEPAPDLAIPVAPQKPECEDR